eukprot:403362177
MKKNKTQNKSKTSKQGNKDLVGSSKQDLKTKKVNKNMNSASTKSSDTDSQLRKKESNQSDAQIQPNQQLLLNNVPEITLEWNDLNLTVDPDHSLISEYLDIPLLRNLKSQSKHVQILKDVSGIAKSGELVAVIGPSGSGKSSLLNLIAKRYSHHHLQYRIKGSIKLNQEQLTHKQFMRVGSFIEQDDVIFETNTPKEVFRYAARFRTDLSDSEIEERVEILIHRLGLHDCQDRMVGGVFLPQISGGERKRTSIGTELMTNPKILILDEPTSGLDSSNAMKIIKLLKREAVLRGAIVICSIHQPSSELFHLFDKTICLSEGQVIYDGETKNIGSYFVNKFGVQIKKYTNPADFLIKISHDPKLASKNLSIDKLVKEAKNEFSKQQKFITKQKHNNQKDQLQTALNVISVERHSSILKQCKTMLIRYANGYYKVPLGMFAIFGTSIMMVAFVGSIYKNVGELDVDQDISILKRKFQEWLGLSFFLGNDVFSICLMSQVIQIPARNPLFRKEKLSGMISVTPYYYVTWFCQSVFILFYPLIQSLGMFLFMGCKDQSFYNYMTFVVNSLLLGLCGSNLGFMWGTFFNNDNLATTSAIVFVMIASLGAGKFVNLGSKSYGVKIISQLSPIRYAVESHFRRLTSEQEEYGPFLLNLFGFKLGDYACQKALLIFALVFFLIGWINLKYQARKL